MKRLSHVFLALAIAALALSPAFAHADQFAFNFSGTGINAAGTFTGTEQTAHPGVYDIADLSGTFSDTNNGLNIMNASITLVPDGAGSPTLVTSTAGSGPGYVSSDGAEVYDNVLSGSPLNLDGYAGMLFTVPGGTSGYEVSLAADGAGYRAWVSSLGTTTYLDNGTTGEALTGSIAETPEPASIALLGTGLVGLAGLARRKIFSA